MTSIKKHPFITIFFCLLLTILNSFSPIAKANTLGTEQDPNTLTATPPSLSVQTTQDLIYLTPYMRYAFNLPIQDAQSIYAQRSKFKPYDASQLIQKPGTYWFLISFAPIEDKNAAAAYLDIGNFLTNDTRVLILPKNASSWQFLENVYTAKSTTEKPTFDSSIQELEIKSELSIFNSGLYDLTSLRDGGELLIYSPGIPSIWFSPTLTLPAKASVTVDRIITPFILISLIILIIFSFWRGLAEHGDARIWAAVLAFFALIQYIWGVPQNADGSLRLWDMVGLISATCALFLLPHIGRHYLATEKNLPYLDGLLQFIALPAIVPIIIISIPLPTYIFLIRFTPLWGLFAFLPLLLCLPSILRRRKGALLYAFFCVSIGIGALLAFTFRLNPTWHIAPQAGLLIAMITIFLAPKQIEETIPEKIFSDNVDYLSDFAENNITMREAFFRVEAKLRDPFDRIMREACFLDFETKTEDFTDSIKILSQRKLNQPYTKHDIATIKDIEKKTDYLRNHVESLVYACKNLSSMLGLMPQLAKKITPHQPAHELFNIKSLVVHACDGIRIQAQDKQIGLGWYIAPHMGLFYRGDKAALKEIVELLLKDSIRATEKGLISIRVRRANTPNPGHIVFTISDSGKGKPPLERSPLTLIKAWELSTKYRGQVELHSSPNGLSFSFSLECIAMDAQGIKPLSFASLDDIVLSNNESSKDKTKLSTPHSYSTNNAQSGGNIVFSKNDTLSDTSNTVNHANNITTNVTAHATHPSSPAKIDIQQIQQPRNNANTDMHTQTITTPEHTQTWNVSSDEIEREENSKVSILLISPLTIQRQNLAWYLNKYETWEALDADSALSFYEKKPARLVLVHSALSVNGCNIVLAGIRLLEDTLGITPAPFVGLYQSDNDIEFLRLAGCNHLLPANIGREDLCSAVAKIMANPFISSMSNIEVEHTTITKKTSNKKEETTHAIANKKITKILTMKREHMGQVIDGGIENTYNNKKTSNTNSPPPHVSQTVYENKNTLTKDNHPLKQGTPLEIVDDTLEDMTESNNNIDDVEFVKPQEKITKSKQTNSRIGHLHSENDAHTSSNLHVTVDVNLDSPNQEEGIIINYTSKQKHLQQSPQIFKENNGLLSKTLKLLRPKPNKSLQTEIYTDDTDLVGDPTPLETEETQNHNQYPITASMPQNTNISISNKTHIDEKEEITQEAENQKASQENPEQDKKQNIHENINIANEEIVLSNMLKSTQTIEMDNEEANLHEFHKEETQNEKSKNAIGSDNNTYYGKNTLGLFNNDAVTVLEHETTTTENETSTLENKHSTHFKQEIVASAPVIEMPISVNQNPYLELDEPFSNKESKSLVFFPTETEPPLCARNEDLPIVTSLPDVFNWDSNSPPPYIQEENIFIHSRITQEETTDNLSTSLENMVDNVSAPYIPETLSMQNTYNDISISMTDTKDEAIVHLTNDMLFSPTLSIDNTNEFLDTSFEERKVHAEEALLNLTLELSHVSENKTHQLAQQNKPSTGINFDLDNTFNKNESTAEYEKNPKKTIQLSFFPTDTLDK